MEMMTSGSSNCGHKKTKNFNGVKMKNFQTQAQAQEQNLKAHKEKKFQTNKATSKTKDFWDRFLIKSKTDGFPISNLESLKFATKPSLSLFTETIFLLELSQSILFHPSLKPSQYPFLSFSVLDRIAKMVA
jgi:hypothetical protein